MMLMSPAGYCGSPGNSRRPLTSTSVRDAPRSRRFTVAVPDAPLEIKAPWSGVTCGSWLMRSSVRVAPCSLNSSPRTIVTGLTAVRLRRGIREPVTMMTFSDLTGAGWVGGGGWGCAAA